MLIARNVLIVGARGGMGEAIVSKFTEAGFRVLAADLAERSPRDADYFQVDVTSAASVDALFEEVAACGGAGVVVFVAGIFEASAFVESTQAQFERLYSVNVFGAHRVLVGAAKAMKAAGGGSVVVVGSQSAKIVRQGQAVYGSSKAALSYVTKVAALELAEYGIRCNLVLPGVTETPMAAAVWNAGKGSAAAHIEGDLKRFRNPIPLQRVAQPEDVANAVAFLASDEARHVTMTEIVVDGGALLSV